MNWIKLPIQDGKVITPKMVNLNEVFSIEVDPTYDKKTLFTETNGKTFQAEVPFFAVVDCIKPLVCPNVTDENGSPV